MNVPPYGVAQLVEPEALADPATMDARYAAASA
jgi:hypothetical protein